MAQSPEESSYSFLLRCIKLRQKILIASTKSNIKFDKPLVDKVFCCTLERGLRSIFLVQEIGHCRKIQNQGNQTGLLHGGQEAIKDADRPCCCSKKYKYVNNVNKFNKSKQYNCGLCKTVNYCSKECQKKNISQITKIHVSLEQLQRNTAKRELTNHVCSTPVRYSVGEKRLWNLQVKSIQSRIQQTKTQL